MTVNNFKKGTQFIITGKPRMWNSSLNDNNPLESNIIYPYKSIIKKIKHSEFEFDSPMTDGFYGWSLSSLLEGNKIIILKEERKKKLIKIYNL